MVPSFFCLAGDMLLGVSHENALQQGVSARFSIAVPHRKGVGHPPRPQQISLLFSSPDKIVHGNHLINDAECPIGH